MVFILRVGKGGISIEIFMKDKAYRIDQFHPFLLQWAFSIFLQQLELLMLFIFNSSLTIGTSYPIDQMFVKLTIGLPK